MVFSQTDANPQSFLKVVELNLLKNRKAANGTTGAIIGGSPQTPTLPAPVATTSFSEVSDSRSVSMLSMLLFTLTLSLFLVVLYARELLLISKFYIFRYF